MKTIRSHAALLPIDDIDTDQIIPARFLKTTSRVGLGKQLFYDWRYGSDGARRPEFVLNRAEAARAAILVSGRNFGCGSSREHAPWALVDHGFKAVVARSFADIFCNNALKNGLLPVALGPDAHAALLSAIADKPALQISIDIEAQRLDASGLSVAFVVEPFARECLLRQIDEMDYLLGFEKEIAAHEQRR